MPLVSNRLIASATFPWPKWGDLLSHDNLTLLSAFPSSHTLPWLICRSFFQLLRNNPRPILITPIALAPGTSSVSPDVPQGVIVTQF